MTPEQKVTATTRALRRATHQEGLARSARDEAVREAVAGGLSLRTVAGLAGLSHQAVAKIVAGGHAATS